MAESAVIYRRVSTKKQQERGYSLPEQLEACQDYACKAGLAVAADFCDAHTGSKASRPQFDGLLAYIEAHKVANVIVALSDRLGRGTAASMARYLISETGATLHFADSGPVGTSDDDLTSTELKEFVSGIERRAIARRCQTGRIGALKAGKILASVPAYGYRRVNGQYVIHEQEAGIIRRIFVEYAAGRSLCQVCEGLSADHIPTRRAGKKQAGRSDSAWNRHVVQAMLQRRVYYGLYQYRSRTHGTFSIKVPAIVSQELWDAAQAARAIHAKRSRRKRAPDAPYMFIGGRARCGQCGRTLSAYLSHGATVRYRCTGDARCVSQDGYSTRCANTIRGDVLEGAVWHYLEGLIDSDWLHSYIDELNERRHAAFNALEGKLAALDRRADALKAKRDKDMDLYEDPASKIDRAYLNERIEAIQAELAEVAARRSALANELDTLLSQIWPILITPDAPPQVFMAGFDGHAPVYRARPEGAVGLDVPLDLGTRILAARDHGGGIVALDPFEQEAAEAVSRIGATPASRREWVERLNVTVEVDRDAGAALVRIGDLRPAIIALPSA